MFNIFSTSTVFRQDFPIHHNVQRYRRWRLRELGSGVLRQSHRSDRSRSILVLRNSRALSRANASWRSYTCRQVDFLVRILQNLDPIRFVPPLLIKKVVTDIASWEKKFQQELKDGINLYSPALNLRLSENGLSIFRDAK